MSRQSRLDELQNHKNFQPGPGRDQKNLDWWSSVAASHSDGADHRASDGPMKLPDTGKSMEVRPTEMKAREPRKINAAMRGENDPNHVSAGKSYMPGVRREV
jgi:hypothetical protein